MSKKFLKLSENAPKSAKDPKTIHRPPILSQNPKLSHNVEISIFCPKCPLAKYSECEKIFEAFLQMASFCLSV